MYRFFCQPLALVAGAIPRLLPAFCTATIVLTLPMTVSAQSKDWGIFIDSNTNAYAGPLASGGKMAYCTGSRFAGQPVEKACGYNQVGGVSGNVSSKYFDDQTALSLKQLSTADYAYRHLDGRYDFGFGRGETTAGADLKNGTLRFTTESDGGGNVGGGGSAVINQVSMFDTITFTGLTKPVEIGFDIRVDGTFQGYLQPRFGFQFYSTLSQLANSRLITGAVGWTEVTPGVPTTTAMPGSLFMDGFGTGRTGNWTTFGPNRFVGTVMIDPLQPIYGFNMYMSAGGRGSADFGHTAEIKWNLPEGVTYSSASGGFFAGSPAAVPEPASWAMLIAGFGLIGSVMRRRKAMPVELRRPIDEGLLSVL